MAQRFDHRDPQGFLGRVGLPPAVLGLCIFQLILLMAWQIPVPILPLAAVQLHATPVLVGITVGASGLLPILLAVPAGWLIDRLPVSVPQVAAAMIMLTGCLLLYAARSLPVLIAGQALLGLANSLASVAGQVFIALASNSENRDRSYSNYTLFPALASIFGPAIGGWLHGWLGSGPAFLVAVAFAAASLPLPFFLPHPEPAPESRRQRAPVLALFALPSMLLVLNLSFLLIFANTLKSSFYVLYLDHMSFSSQGIGLLLALSGVATIIARPMMAVVAARTGRHLLLGLICLGMGCGFALVPLAGASQWGQAALALLTGAAFGFSQPLTMAMVSHAAAAENLGLAFGWRQIFQRAAEFGSPLLAGVLVSGAGLTAAFGLAALLPLVAGVAVVRNAVTRTEQPSA